MSYCRWSSDSYRCDLYCFESVYDCYTTHVASSRIPDDAPREMPMPMLCEECRHKYDAETEGMAPRDRVEHRFQRCEPCQTALNDWIDSHEKLMTYLKDCKHTAINGPYDGETFNDSDLESFRGTLVMLREAGYRFPDYVLEAVDEEIAEAATTNCMES